MPYGKLIVLEGADGCGKSTHAKLLGEHLKKQGRDLVMTAEPTKGFIGTGIRKILGGNKTESPEILALLFAADRKEHIETIILPALKEGKIVITDRYLYSNIAYQGVQGISPDWVSEINSFAPEPDLVLVLSIPSTKAMERMFHREREIFEFTEFQEKVQKRLFDIANGGSTKLSVPGKKWVIVSTSGELEATQEKIRKEVSKIL